MHPAPAFRMKGEEEMRGFVQGRSFATLFVAAGGGHIVHAPVVLSGDRAAFHLSRGNAAFPHLDGADALAVLTDHDCYVSPDWYGIDDQVPTWNYQAVELRGPLQALSDDELIQHIDDLSAQEEAKLAPKMPWTRAKMDDGIFRKMLTAIGGFEMCVEDMRGTAKFSQNKPHAVRERVAAILHDRGQAEIAAKVNPA